MTTFTIPAPACPSISSLAISSWAFFMLSCIACACFMSPASWFFIIVATSSRGSARLDRIGTHARVEPRHDVLHEWIVAKRLLRARASRVALALFLSRQGRIGALAHFETKLQAASEGLFQRGLELVG